MQRQYRFVSADHLFMRAAREYAFMHSTVSTQPTGAVVVKGGVIIGVGANQSRLKNKILLFLHKMFCIRKLLHIKTGTRYWLCPGCADYHDHAEARASRDAARIQDAQDSTLYLWGHWWCCEPCWETMRAAGIRNVYLMEGSEKVFNTKR
jgi:deoxycytidylate deaminase